MSPTFASLSVIVAPVIVAPEKLGLALDLFGLALVLVFVVLGFRGGLWWQLVRLLGLVAVLAVARGFGPPLGAGLGSVFPGLEARVATGLGWALVALTGGLVVALVARLGKRDDGAPVELGFVERAGGALAGALAGVVLHVTLLLCGAQFATPEWAAARLADTRSRTLMSVVERGVPGLVEVHAAESLGLAPRR